MIAEVGKVGCANAKLAKATYANASIDKVTSDENKCHRAIFAKAIVVRLTLLTFTFLKLCYMS